MVRLSEYVVGITGASGSIYGIRLVEELARKNCHVQVVITSAGKKVMAVEVGTSDFFHAIKGRHVKKENITLWDNDDFTAPFMSGSSAPDAVIVIPCSVGKLAALSNGISTNLLERTADVALKERRQLILVVRETPFSIIHLENMLSAAKAGAQIMPAIPGVENGKVLETILNPSKEPCWKFGNKGGCQDIFFVTTLDKTPGFVNTIQSLAEALNYPFQDIGVYIQPVHQGTSCHCEFNLPFDPEDESEVARIQELYTRASEELLKQGAFFSRPYGIWADMEYNRAAMTTAVLKKVKGIFDPKNVLNPGKLCF